MKNVLRSVWDKLALYLPVILMGVFALGTYWLVRSTPALLSAPKAALVQHEPDYFMRGFSVKTFDASGRLKSEVFGAEARHYPDTDTLEIDGVRIRSFDVADRLTTVTARRAQTNSDASELQLFGDALVVREPQKDKAGRLQPRMEFKSEFLHAFMETERIESDKPVDLRRGDDRFTADAMEFDNLGRVMQLTGRVKGTLAPARSR